MMRLQIPLIIGKFPSSAALQSFILIRGLDVEHASLRNVWQTSRMLSEEDVQLVIQYMSSTKLCSSTSMPSNPPIAVALTFERHLIMSGEMA
jgi:hypothetical protein